MRAMVMKKAGMPLELREIAVPEPAATQVLIKVSACGVCRTDLHIVDGELRYPKLPLVPGHEIIGRVTACGKDAGTLTPGMLVGVPWLAYTCGVCRYCRQGMENLCENALFTGYTMNGGYAGYTVAFEKYCIPLTEGLATPASAPLLCAGLIGYRSYRMLPAHADPVGIYGIGAAAHILIQLMVAEGKTVYAFTRPGDTAAQEFALQLGAVWAGNSGEKSPEKLAGALIFAPEGGLVPASLQNLDKGGITVCGGIHMSDIPSFPYDLLWEERSVRSVANLTREDGISFFRKLKAHPIHTTVKIFPLEKANEALSLLRSGDLKGAAVLVP